MTQTDLSEVAPRGRPGGGLRPGLVGEGPGRGVRGRPRVAPEEKNVAQVSSLLTL